MLSHQKQPTAALLLTLAAAVALLVDPTIARQCSYGT
jgi:hypothetical protein